MTFAFDIGLLLRVSSLDRNKTDTVTTIFSTPDSDIEAVSN